MTDGEKNARTLAAELAWFDKVLETRIALYFENPCPLASIDDVVPPDLRDDDSPYARLVRDHLLGFDERLVLVLALLPHLRPQALDTFFISNTHFNRPFTEFGGIVGKSHGGFLPTGETLAFVLGGQDLNRRFGIRRFFEDGHVFKRKNVVSLNHTHDDEPYLCGALVMSNEYLNLFTSGIHHKPDFTMFFPARRIETPLTWDDLVLAHPVLDEIDIINGWIRHSETIMNVWGLSRVLKPGYRALFYGPPGTGKTLTATLIGKSAGVDVYRIDLSMIISKYIGETEKNLAHVFNQAENKNWILFFDEADALFGKRTQANTSNDRFANQEISYLLQRVEDFPGVVILATNLKSNIDEAFSRRFQSVVYFPMPDAELRAVLWRKMLDGRCGDSDDNAIEALAARYELAGGAIVNVVRYAAIKALSENRETLTLAHLMEGIRKEMMKEGRTI